MDSILEKITLYDILGYFFPGSVLTLMLLLGGMEQCAFEIMVKWKDNIAVLHLAFILISYLAGVVLSEVSELAGGCVRKVFAKKQTTENMLSFFKDQVAEALIRSGKNDTKENIIEQLGKGDTSIYYKKYIYGIIQGCQNYKRIHSYASAYVMYKNIAAALLIGSFILFVRFHVNGLFCVGGAVLGVLMFRRSHRFNAKKEQYALIWFMEKYGAKENCKAETR